MEGHRTSNHTRPVNEASKTFSSSDKTGDEGDSPDLEVGHFWYSQRAHKEQFLLLIKNDKARLREYGLGTYESLRS